MDAGERGEPGQGQEGELQPDARAGERDRADGDGAESQRVRERLGEDPAGVDQVRHRERECAEGKADPGPQAEPPGEEEDRDGGQRHGERAQRLDDAERRLDVVEEPGRGGEQGVEGGRGSWAEPPRMSGRPDSARLRPSSA